MNRKERRALRPHEIAKADQTRSKALEASKRHGFVLVDEHTDTGECRMCDTHRDVHDCPLRCGKPATARFLVMIRGRINSEVSTCPAHEEIARMCLTKGLAMFAREAGIPVDVEVSGDYDDDLSGGVA